MALRLDDPALPDLPQVGNEKNEILKKKTEKESKWVRVRK